MLGLVLVIACAVGVGRAGRRRGWERGFGRSVGAALLLAWPVMQGYYLLIEADWSESLPLHFCDLASLVGPVAVIWPRRTLRALLYFWGFGYTVWGVATPMLSDGPGTLNFWFFWLSHGGVLLLASYDLIVRGYRPTAGEFGRVCAITAVYILLIIPVNIVFNWNYAYIGPVDPTPGTPLDLLPAWPWRIGALMAMGWFMLFGPLVAWWVVRRLTGGRAGAEALPCRP